ncbi:MAG: dihydrodipicolinate synthase family protein [Planctomycetia bacterium]|nr:dihydrodipicolinate synthase family protein [Planctomycetia bacterium]
MMKTPNDGFYTALGTPLDKNGNVITASLKRQVEQQINAGCAGLLVLGSMGMQSCVKTDQCVCAVQAAAEANRGVKPLFAGVMDNSIERVLDRIDALKSFPLDGVVLTTPFYFTCDAASLVRFFTRVADRSAFPVYMYDLPGVTKQKITFDIVKQVSQHENIRGIKTGDLTLARQITYYGETKESFKVLFSGLDVFDAANAFGIRRNLDGMFACCPHTAQKTFQAFANNNIAEGTKYLTQILNLRDTMFKYDIFPAFTVTMNLLGCDGAHAPDYEGEVSEEGVRVLTDLMRTMGEI